MAPKKDGRKKKKCSQCKKSFTNKWRLDKHIKGCKRDEPLQRKVTCLRCHEDWLDTDSYAQHLRFCLLRCKNQCREKAFQNKFYAQKHEEVCQHGQHDDWPTTRQWQIPENSYSFFEQDALTIINDNLGPAQQEGLPASDAAIDAYFGCLVQKYPKCAARRICETQVYELGLGAPPNYEKEDMNGKELIFLPVSLVDFHWALIVFEKREGFWWLLDSLYKPSPQVLARATEVVKGYKDFFKVDGAFSDEVRAWPNDCQFQGPANNNCGIFACYFASRLCQQSSFDPEVSMLAFRKHMLNTIMELIGPEEVSKKEQKGGQTPGMEPAASTVCKISSDLGIQPLDKGTAPGCKSTMKSLKRKAVQESMDEMGPAAKKR